MDALTGGLIGASAGAGVVGGVLNYQEAQKARKERGAMLDRLDAIANAIKNPKFDTKFIRPEDYAAAKIYKPELAAYIEEKAPQLVKAESEGAVQGRSAQMDALNRLRSLSMTGEDTQSQLLREKALNAVAQQNAAQQGAIRDRFAQQGRGGSANEYVAALLAQQGANQNAAQTGQQSAMDAYNTRLQAVRDSANLGGNIRQQDVDLESKNAQTLNDWNRRMASSYQDNLNSRAASMNQGNLFNIENRQKIGQANVAQRNAANQGYQQMINGLAQQQYGNNVQRAGLQSGAVNAQIGNITQSAGDTQKAYGDIFGGLAKGASSYADYNEKELDREKGYKR